MGTRHSTMVISEGKTKVAQYGQWDGYPSGQGMTILRFLQGVDLAEFKKKIDSLGLYTEEEIEAMNTKIQDGEFDDWKEKHPELSRDTGARVLELIDLGLVTKVQLDEDFINDRVFCEWGYIINLDDNTLSIKCGADKTYDLSNLPSSEEEFLSELGVEY
jgi:hypothetical protein